MFTVLFLLLALRFAALTGLCASPAPSSQPKYLSVDGTHVTLATPSTPTNGAWQWWYFDFVSDTDDSCVQVVFYSGYAFGTLLGPGLDYYVQVSGTYANGTMWESFSVPSSSGTVTTSSDVYYASEGSWPGVGGWKVSGTPDAPVYTVSFDLPAVPGEFQSVSGELILHPTAAPHYPCPE